MAVMATATLPSGDDVAQFKEAASPWFLSVVGKDVLLTLMMRVPLTFLTTVGWPRVRAWVWAWRARHWEPWPRRSSGHSRPSAAAPHSTTCGKTLRVAAGVLVLMWLARRTRGRPLTQVRDETPLSKDSHKRRQRGLPSGSEGPILAT